MKLVSYLNDGHDVLALLVDGLLIQYGAASPRSAHEYEHVPTVLG